MNLFNKLPLKYFSFLLLLLSHLSYLKAQDFKNIWTIGGTKLTEYLSGMVSDKQGNLYVTGEFSGTVDFDLGPKVFTLTSKGEFDDVFLAKYDSVGNLNWAFRLGVKSNRNITDVAVDDLGNVYFSGSFLGTVDFDLGNSVYNIISDKNMSFFIAKYNPQGKFIWAKSIMSDSSIPTTECSAKLKLYQGNIYAYGHFESRSDFDPGAGTYFLTPYKDADLYILKLDTSGLFIWARQFKSRMDQTYCSLEIDSKGNLLSSAFFRDSIDLDPGVNINKRFSLSNSQFFVKLDPNGDLINCWTLGNPKASGRGVLGNHIEIDDSNNIYNTGIFDGTVDFDPGLDTNEITSFNGEDIYIAKYNPSGFLLWVKRLYVHDDGTESSGIKVDRFGHVYVFGVFLDTIDFDPDTGTYNLTAWPENGAFLMKLNENGSFLWADGFTGDLDVNPRCMDFGPNGTIHFSGYFLGTPDFDPGSGIKNIKSQGEGDIFILNLGNCFNGFESFPKDQTANEKSIIKFGVKPVFNNFLYQWQQDIGGNFTNLADTGCFYGTKTDTLKINPVKFSLDKTAFRCKISQNNCSVSSQPFILTVKKAGIDFFKSSSLWKVYPNPADQWVSMEIPENFQCVDFSIQVIDAWGRIVINATSPYTNEPIYLNNLNSGIYYLIFQNSEHKFSTRFTKR